MTSLIGQFPIVVFESLAYGTAPVAGRPGNVDELTRDPAVRSICEASPEKISEPQKMIPETMAERAKYGPVRRSVAEGHPGDRAGPPILEAFHVS